MVRPGSPQEPQNEPRTNEDLSILYADCLDAVRRGATHEAWQEIRLRIRQLRQQIEQQAVGAGECTFCGGRRPTSTLHVLDLHAPAGRWTLCFRCWHLLEFGFMSMRPAADLRAWPAMLPSLTDSEVRGYIRAGAARLGRVPSSGH